MPSAEQLGFHPPEPIPAGVSIHTFELTPGSRGISIECVATVSGTGLSTMDCNNAPDSIYCDTPGPYILGLFGDAATSRWADDVVTVGNKGCLIDRYVIRVTGDLLQNGSGAALGGYTVKYALYDACPGASGESPRTVPGTSGSYDVPAEQAGDIVEIVHRVPAFEEAVMPSAALFLSVSFNRPECGAVVGPGRHRLPASALQLAELHADLRRWNGRSERAVQRWRRLHCFLLL